MGGGEMQGYQVEPWTAVISHHERSAVEQRLEFSCEGPPPPPAPWPGPWADWTGGLRCCDGWLSGAGGGGWGLLRPVCPPADAMCTREQTRPHVAAPTIRSHWGSREAGSLSKKQPLLLGLIAKVLRKLAGLAPPAAVWTSWRTGTPCRRRHNERPETRHPNQKKMRRKREPTLLWFSWFARESPGSLYKLRNPLVVVHRTILLPPGRCVRSIPR